MWKINDDDDDNDDDDADDEVSVFTSQSFTKLLSHLGWTGMGCGERKYLK